MNYNYKDLDAVNQELAGIWPGWSAVKVLGRGASGAVYEIHRNVRSNLEKAAMKVIRVPAGTAEIEQLRFQGMELQDTEEYYEQYVDNIQGEIRIMQNFVGNSHIVSYEDYSICKRQDSIGWDIFIRMELLTGLQEYIRNNPMDERRVIKLGADILQGLRVCHKSGIIHRDIKPGNIFVNKAGDFKLGDFGIARTTPESDDILSYKGTLGYMAPEVYRRESTDARSDIYSLGMVMYQCLNDNRLPFVPKNFTPKDVEKARERRLSGEWIPDPANGSSRLKAVVRKAMADRPEDRYHTADEMYRALGEAYRAEYEGKSKTGNNTGIRYGNGGKTEKSKEEAVVPKKGKLMLAILFVLAVAVILFVLKGLIGRSDHSDYAMNWNDAALEAKMREITGISSGDIMFSDVRDITSLDLSNADEKAEDDVKISNINALSDLKNLKILKLNFNRIKDISALSSLTDLEELSMDFNQVEDISALSELAKLEELDLSRNQVKDIGPLNKLTNLKRLYLFNNKIQDISALSNLTNLDKLSLARDQIEDISALSNLTNLKRLYLYSNKVQDISALSKLTNLDKLSLGDNRIEDISPLSKLTNLKRLYLYSNQISDISALSNLTNLIELSLDGNQITDYSPIEDLNISILKK